MMLLLVLFIVSIQIAWSTACFSGGSHSVCYDYDTGVTSCVFRPFGYSRCSGSVIGTSDSLSCDDFVPDGYIRCVSTTNLGSTCRPVEAGCGENEFQQPSGVTNRAAFLSLRPSYDTIEECEAINPYIRCAKDHSISSASTRTCIADTEFSWRGCHSGHARVPSDTLFIGLDECNDYQPSSYMRCEGSSKYCSEFDSETLFECQKTGYERLPIDGIFTTSSCSNEKSWNLCWEDGTGLTCEESSSSCRANDETLIKLTQMTRQGCLNYVPKWSRWVKNTVVECLPISEEGEDIEPTTSGYSRVPNDVEYSFQDDCKNALIYIRCYDYISNKMYCPKDISSCLSGDRQLTQAVFENWSECIQPSGLLKCLDPSTAEITCRPSQSDCGSEELLATVLSADTDDCLEANVFYYYCYDTDNPTHRTCVKDYMGCGDYTPLWKTANTVRKFTSITECEEFEPTWRVCSDDNPNYAVCRPEGATFDGNRYPCKSTERRDSRSFSILDNCLNRALYFMTEVNA